MKVGVIKEIKDKENRIALTPEGAKALTEAGHQVLIEKDAGSGSGFSDADYQAAGATIVPTKDAWASDLVIKVKEPLESEYPYLDGQIVFTYFHLAGVVKSLTEALLEKRVTAVAYETVEDKDGKLPLLEPMSAVAGHMAATIGSYYLAKFNQGKGVLLSRILDEQYGKVLILGDGVVGRYAAKAATGLGADVFICGRHEDRVPKLKAEISKSLNFVLSSKENIREHLKDTDLLIGAVLIHGARAPYLVTEDMVQIMQAGSVIVDVSIDQGGCVETSRSTSHSDPTFERHGVIHYCVTNMPGAYPRTSTLALTTATLPYALKLAEKGIKAFGKDEGFAAGINTHSGYLTYKPVAEALGLTDTYSPLSQLHQ
ncbi:MAG: alanine dehydrogenase [Woeseia sp.]